MNTTRRGFILAAGSLPLVHLLSRAQGLWRSSAEAVTPALRPYARLADRALCAHCGAEDHLALDADCPAVAAAVTARQGSARAASARRARLARADQRREA